MALIYQSHLKMTLVVRLEPFSVKMAPILKLEP